MWYRITQLTLHNKKNRKSVMNWVGDCDLHHFQHHSTISTIQPLALLRAWGSSCSPVRIEVFLGKDDKNQKNCNNLHGFFLHTCIYYSVLTGDRSETVPSISMCLWAQLFFSSTQASCSSNGELRHLKTVCAS